MMKLFLLLSYLFCSISFGQRADFFREDITFRLDSTHIDVNGFYWFANKNSKPVNSNIFYPFPNYSNEKIDSIRLYNFSRGQQPVYTNEGSHGISFDLYLPPFDTALFQIGYRQELISDSAVYILKTTEAWGKPLRLAEYKLIIPQSLIIKKFSYPPDKEYNIENCRIYYWKKLNFMPLKNMVFYFLKVKR